MAARSTPTMLVAAISVAAVLALVVAPAAAQCDVGVVITPSPLFYSWIGVSLTASATTNGTCGSGPTIYNWTQTAGPPIELDPVTLNHEELYIHPYTLSPDVSYTFEVSASVGGGGSGVASTVVVLPQSPLEARVLGGNYREHAEEITLFVEVALDDPDDAGEPTTDYEGSYVEWTCTPPAGESCPSLAGNTSQTLRFYPFELARGEWSFAATVHLNYSLPGARSATTVAAVVNIDSDRDPTALIYNFAAEDVSVTQAFRVHGYGKSHYNDENGNEDYIEYNWRWIGPATVDLTDANNLLTDDQNPVIVFAPHVLSPNTTYTIVLTVRDYGNNRNEAYFTFTTGAVPSGGSCVVSPESGVELETEFTLSCGGWVSPKHSDSPILAQFGFASPAVHVEKAGPGVAPLFGAASVVKTLPSYLPRGDADNGYELEVVFSVADAFGSTVRVVVNVTVTPTTNGDASSLQGYLNTVVAPLIDAGSVVEAAGQLSVLVSALNEIETATELLTIRDSSLTEAQRIDLSSLTSTAELASHAFIAAALSDPVHIKDTHSLRATIAAYMAAVAGESLRLGITQGGQVALLTAAEQLAASGREDPCTDAYWYDIAQAVLGTFEYLHAADLTSLVCGQEAEVVNIGGLTWTNQLLTINSLRGLTLSLPTILEANYDEDEDENGDLGRMIVEFPDDNDFFSEQYYPDQEECVQIRSWTMLDDLFARMNCEDIEHDGRSTGSVIHGLTLWDLLFDEAFDVSDLDEPIAFQFPRVVDKHASNKDQCVYFSHDSQNWNDGGCSAGASQDAYARCECDHLTEFSIQTLPSGFVPAVPTSSGDGSGESSGSGVGAGGIVAIVVVALAVVGTGAAAVAYKYEFLVLPDSLRGDANDGTNDVVLTRERASSGIYTEFKTADLESPEVDSLIGDADVGSVEVADVAVAVPSEADLIDGDITDIQRAAPPAPTPGVELEVPAASTADIVNDVDVDTAGVDAIGATGAEPVAAMVGADLDGNTAAEGADGSVTTDVPASESTVDVDPTL